MIQKDFFRIVADEAGLTIPQAKAIFEAGLNALTMQVLSQKDEITFRDFGTFRLSKINARIGRNPKTGLEVKVEEHHVVRFRPSKALKAQVRNV